MEYSTAVTKLYGVTFACLPVYVVAFFIPGNFIRWPAPLYNFIPEQIIKNKTNERKEFSRLNQ